MAKLETIKTESDGYILELKEALKLNLNALEISQARNEKQRQVIKEKEESIQTLLSKYVEFETGAKQCVEQFDADQAQYKARIEELEEEIRSLKTEMFYVSNTKIDEEKKNDLSISDVEQSLQAVQADNTFMSQGLSGLSAELTEILGGETPPKDLD